MSLVTALRNAATSTNLKEGSIDALMTRVEAAKKGLSETDQLRLDAKIADAFATVSEFLDGVSGSKDETVVNRSQRGFDRSAYQPPKAVA